MMRAEVAVVALIALINVDDARSEAQDVGAFYGTIKLVGGYAEVEGLRPAGTLSGPLYLSSDTEDVGTDDDLHDLVGGVAVALGYDFGRLRTEVEYGWRYRFDLNGNLGRADPGPGRTATFRSEVTSHSLMVNLLWDLERRYTLFDYGLQPYLGVGAGRVTNRAKTWLFNFGTAVETATTSDRGDAWMVTLGANVAISEDWGAEVAYRYMELGKIRIGPQSGGAEIHSSGYRSHDLLFGIRYRF